MIRASLTAGGISSRTTDAPLLKPISATRPLETFDAVAAFKRISGNGQGFILDGHSPEAGAGRFVYVGAGDCERLLTGPGTVTGDVNPALALREKLAARRLVTADCGERWRAPAGSGLMGAVGYFSYEAIRHFEPSVGDLPVDPLNLPESAFFLPDRFVVYDRLERVLTAVVLVDAEAGEIADERARATAFEMVEAASCETDSSRSDFQRSLWNRRSVGGSGEVVASDSFAKSRFKEMVQKAKREIERGELIQVVLSQRSVRRTDASPLDVYSELAALNPSPYMFMLNFGDFALVGSSPELMVRSQGRYVSMHPIAGTRPRGATPEEDAALEAELLTNEKERAEHVMLVDLARNDLGRVSVAGSVNVDSFMKTERYSHVMHLVSRVNGRLRTGADGLDAFVAGFPLGTLAGAPRLRAVQMIAELESEGRGPYCGGVGWFDASGDVDAGTVIRCIAMKDGVAHVQGGAGIVFDSEPEREYLESVQKMAAQFDALEMAEGQNLGATRGGTGVASG